MAWNQRLQGERVAVRPPSKKNTPSHGLPHKFHILRLLVDNQNVSRSITLGLWFPDPRGEPNSNTSSSSTGSNDNSRELQPPGPHKCDAQTPQNHSACYSFIMFVVEKFKSCEVLHGSDLANAIWKSCMLFTGNCIKCAYGTMVVWSMDALCVSTSLDLHNARLVLLYIPQWDADLENSHTALHDFRTRLKKNWHSRRRYAIVDLC